MNDKINCLILDDEPLAVQLIADYASKISKLNILYSGSDVFEAVSIINTQRADLIFIDIQMPQLTGIELMEMFNRTHNFIVISAYPEYALQAFNFHVVDFLLKPATFNRFYQSVEKFIRWQDTFHSTTPEDFLFVKDGRRHHKIETGSIIYIEGLKDYIRIYTGTERIVVLENMKDILEKLPKNRFVRIHRSYIIPKDKIRVIDGNRIQLVNGSCLPVGETYRRLIREWLT